MAQKLDADLNIIQRSDIEIQIDPLTKDLDIIQKLDDEPNDVGGLTAAELKAKFDESGNTIKEYINETLIPQVLSEGAAEKQRERQEQVRQDNEAQRQANEQVRQSNEAARVEAEAARRVWEDYDPERAYVPGNKVYWAGSSYVNKAPCTGVPPYVAEYWQLVAKRGETVGDGMTEEDADERYLRLSGGWMTGPMTVLEPELPGSPTPKRYLQPESITITRLPDKTSYLIGTIFDPTGMTADGNYADGGKGRIFGYIGAVPDVIEYDTEKVTVSYIENRAVRTADLPLLQRSYPDFPFQKTAVPKNNNPEWHPPMYADGVLVLPPYSDSGAAYSEDCGKTWTKTSLPVVQHWNPPVYADGMWVMGPSYVFNSSIAAYSEDGGRTWVQAPLPISQGWSPPVYGDGVWVMGPGSPSTASASSVAAYSADGGKTWNQASLPASKNWGPPVYADGVWLMSPGYSANSNIMAYSEDGGRTWSAKSLPISQKWGNPIYGGGVWVLYPYANQSTTAAYSEDGETWTASTLPFPGNWSAPIYDGVSWVWKMDQNLTYNSVMLTSEDGKTWIQRATLTNISGMLVYGGGTWILAPAEITANNAVAYSINGGQDWFKTNLPASQRWMPPVYADGVWIMVPSENQTVTSHVAAYSEDGGKTWIQADLPVSSSWRQPVYADGMLICVGGASVTAVAAYSEDRGKSWVQADLPFSQQWLQPLFCNGVWFLCPKQGNDAAYCSSYKVLEPLPGKEVDLSAPKSSLEDQINTLMAETAALTAAIERGLSL